MQQRARRRVVVYPKGVESYVKDGKEYFPGTGFMLADTYKDGMRLSAAARRGLPAPGASRVRDPPVGWLASEKMDGLRAIWNGRDLVTRPSLGKDPKKFTSVPGWFLDALPPGIALDGELWMGRGKFGEVAGISNKLVADDAQWNLVSYGVFDAPGVDAPLEDRLRLAASALEESRLAWDAAGGGKRRRFPVSVVESVKIQSPDHLERFFGEVASGGGEGVILRAPRSPYVPKRSKYMLKVKISRDTEVVVDGHVAGEGKYAGAMGALVGHEAGFLERAVCVGTGFTDVQRRDHGTLFPPGTVISVSFMERTPDGRLRMPVFRGVREDAPFFVSNQ